MNTTRYLSWPPKVSWILLDLDSPPRTAGYSQQRSPKVFDREAATIWDRVVSQPTRSASEIPCSLSRIHYIAASTKGEYLRVGIVEFCTVSVVATAIMCTDTYTRYDCKHKEYFSTVKCAEAGSYEDADHPWQGEHMETAKFPRRGRANPPGLDVRKCKTRCATRPGKGICLSCNRYLKETENSGK
jgi:hypothetical protein